MVAQVLEITKHENRMRTSRPYRDGMGARVYRFPSRGAASQDAPPASRFRLHLALELAIGLAVWLTWFLWHLAH